jgi:hypothetical protein
MRGTVNSTGQSGGVTAGTINVYPLPRQANNQQIIDQVALLMDQGSAIADAWKDAGDTEALKRDGAAWVNAVYKYISGSLGVSYAIQFKNIHVSIIRGPSGAQRRREWAVA